MVLFLFWVLPTFWSWLFLRGEGRQGHQSSRDWFRTNTSDKARSCFRMSETGHSPIFFPFWKMCSPLSRKGMMTTMVKSFPLSAAWKENKQVPKLTGLSVTRDALRELPSAMKWCWVLQSGCEGWETCTRLQNRIVELSTVGQLSWR